MFPSTERLLSAYRLDDYLKQLVSLQTHGTAPEPPFGFWDRICGVVTVFSGALADAICAQ